MDIQHATAGRSPRTESLLFVLQAVLATCLLGVAIDVVTANVAVEYFTVHHPHVVDSESPWVMALVWGIGASWWFGFIAAVLLWWVNSRRARPLPRKTVLRMVVRSLIFIWVFMIFVVGAVYAIGGLVPPAQRRPTFDSDRRLMAVAMAHATEYVLGGILTVVLMIRIARLRN